MGAYDYLKDFKTNAYFRQRSKMLEKRMHPDYMWLFEKIISERERRAVFERAFKVG